MPNRSYYPWLLFGVLVPFLLFELVPASVMPWHRWLYLVGTLSTVLACLDLLLQIHHVYSLRGDLVPLRWPLSLVASFVILLCLGRVLHFVSFFAGSFYAVEAGLVLLSGAVAVVAVWKAHKVQPYVLELPSLGDMKRAADETADAKALLRLREDMAFDAMVISADATIIEANRWAYRILEYDFDKQELVGMRAIQIIHEDDHPTVYRNLHINCVKPYIVRAVTKNGAVRYIQVRGADFTRRVGDVTDTVRVTNFRDVTLERRYLRELEGRKGVQDDAELDRMSADLADLRAYFYPAATRYASSSDS